MRNLKKILAMALALVMSLSLMATAGAAETTAVSGTSQYQTATKVLKGVKVIWGDEGGDRLQDTITRAEVAALLYRISTGDVTDSQKDLYTNNAFTDVNGIEWARGYISYCYNAEIIKGNPDGTFQPDENITGYATLAMILRAMGYGKNGEFVGDGWEIQTAATGERIGVLKNINQAQLGQPATREMVAEILFRAILKETVEFSALNPYAYPTTGKTLAKEKLGLEEITGIITANEYADLYGSSTLAEGKTRILVDGADYTINHSSALEDIGETCLAYIKDGKEVLDLTDDGTEYPETFDATTLSSFLSSNNLRTNGDTEWFVNFGPGTNWTSPMKVKYVLDLEWNAISATDEQLINRYIRDNLKVRGFTLMLPVYNADVATVTHIDNDKNRSETYTLKTDANGDCVGIVYSREFVIREDITPAHQNNIEVIFNIADKQAADNGAYITGEVYVGTTSRTDISDEISLEKFIADYTDQDDEDLVSGNENGNWLKVIDNDGDGYAEYVLKTIYTFAQVSDVRNDVYTLDTKNEALCNNTLEAVNLLTNEEVSPETEMDLNDVVYYAIIDGVARAYKADMVTATIEKVDHNGKYAVTTDGDEYKKSGVHEHILDPLYKSALTDLAGKVTYDLYFDRGGHLGVFIESNVAHGFKLIVDGWFNSTKTGYEYAVKAYNDETEEFDTIDLNSSASLFVGKDVVYNDGRVERTTDNNDWNALKYLGNVNGEDALDDGRSGTAGSYSYNAATLNGDSSVEDNRLKTTVAAITSDNSILPVENTAVDNRGDHYMIDILNNAIPKAPITEGNIYTTSINSDTAYDDGADVTNGLTKVGVEVRALNNTVYYAVYKDASGNFRVIREVGYANVSAYPKEDIEDVYVVATPQKRISSVGNDDGAGNYEDKYNETYYVAEVVVIELKRYEDDKVPVLVYDSPYVYSTVTIDNVKMIDNTGAAVEVDIDLQRSKDLTGDYFINYGIANNKVLRPGLYWRTPTTTEGLYTLSPMTRYEIAENFTVGQVETGKQSQKAWVDISVLNVKDNAAGNAHVTFDGRNTKVERLSAPVSYVPTGSEVFWTLSYGSANYAAANLTASSESVVFSEQANRSTQYERKDWYDENGNGRFDDATDMRWHAFEDKNGNEYWNDGEVNWNYNDVLVYANSKGNIVYAVSFENLVSESGAALDYAQTVWFNCLGRVNPNKGNTITIKADTTSGVATEKFKICDRNGNVLFSNGVAYTTTKNDNRYDIKAPAGWKFATTGHTVSGGSFDMCVVSSDGKTLSVTIDDVTGNAVVNVTLAANSNEAITATVKKANGDTNTDITATHSINSSTPIDNATITLSKKGGTLDPAESINVLKVIYDGKDLIRGTDFTVTENGTKITFVNSDATAKFEGDIEIVAEITDTATYTVTLTREGVNTALKSAVGTQTIAGITVVSYTAQKPGAGTTDDTKVSCDDSRNGVWVFTVSKGYSLVVKVTADGVDSTKVYGDVTDPTTVGAAANITITVPYVASADEQTVIVANGAKYATANGADVCLPTIGGKALEESWACDTLDKALDVETNTPGELTVVNDDITEVEGSTTTAAYGPDKDGLTVYKVVAENKEIRYYAVKVTVDPDANVLDAEEVFSQDDISESEADADAVVSGLGDGSYKTPTGEDVSISTSALTLEGAVNYKITADNLTDPANKTTEFVESTSDGEILVVSQPDGTTVTIKEIPRPTTVSTLSLNGGQRFWKVTVTVKANVDLTDEEVDLTITVAAVTVKTFEVGFKPARVWNKSEGSAADNGQVATNPLYKTYDVSATDKGTETGVDYNITITATDVVKHQAGSAQAGEKWWVGFAAIPTDTTVSNETVLYCGTTLDSVTGENYASAKDTDCTFTKQYYEDIETREGVEKSLIAEYFGCGDDATTPYTGEYYVRIDWKMSGENTATVTQIYKVTLNITKAQETTQNNPAT